MAYKYIRHNLAVRLSLLKRQAQEATLVLTLRLFALKKMLRCQYLSTDFTQ